VNAVRAYSEWHDPTNAYCAFRGSLARVWIICRSRHEGLGVPLDRRAPTFPASPEACLRPGGFFLIHHCLIDVRWSGRGNNRLQLGLPQRRRVNNTAGS